LRRKIFLIGTTFSGYGCSAAAEFAEWVGACVFFWQLCCAMDLLQFYFLTSKSKAWQSHPMNKQLPKKAVHLNEVKTTEARKFL
jgi:hypothetical protein